MVDKIIRREFRAIRRKFSQAKRDPEKCHVLQSQISKSEKTILKADMKADRERDRLKRKLSKY